jgi:hypothetical protein
MRGAFARTLCLLLACTAVPAALADDPCADDVARLCPNVKAGSGRVLGCLQDNEPRLSAACHEKLDADALKARRLIEEFGRACREDVTQFCAGVEPGEFRVIGCLGQHQLDISPSCQAEMRRIGEARDRASAVRTACQADVQRFCKDVPPHAGPLL